MAYGVDPSGANNYNINVSEAVTCSKDFQTSTCAICAYNTLSTCSTYNGNYTAPVISPANGPTPSVKVGCGYNGNYTDSITVPNLNPNLYYKVVCYAAPATLVLQNGVATLACPGNGANYMAADAVIFDGTPGP